MWDLAGDLKDVICLLSQNLNAGDVNSVRTPGKTDFQ